MHNDLAHGAWAVCGTRGQSGHLSPPRAGGCVPTVEIFEATAPVSEDEVSVQPDWALPHTVFAWGGAVWMHLLLIQPLEVCVWEMGCALHRGRDGMYVGANPCCSKPCPGSPCCQQGKNTFLEVSARHSQSPWVLVMVAVCLWLFGCPFLPHLGCPSIPILLVNMDASQFFRTGSSPHQWRGGWFSAVTSESSSAFPALHMWQGHGAARNELPRTRGHIILKVQAQQG